MALSEHTAKTALTIGSSEVSLVSGTTTLQNVTDEGYYQLFIDGIANLTKTDYFMVRGYEKVRSGGTKRKFYEATISHVQSELFVTPSFHLIHGWDFVMLKIAGTDRAFDTSIRRAS